MMKEASLRMPSMHCSSCASTITRHLKVLPGVSAADVNAESKVVRVTYDESEVSLDKIRDSLEDIGFYTED